MAAGAVRLHARPCVRDGREGLGQLPEVCRALLHVLPDPAEECEHVLTRSNHCSSQRPLKGPLRTVRYVGGGVVASSRPYVPSALERTRVPFRFITMFSMMISSGMPELTKEEDIRYLQEAFALDMTDASAV